MKKIIIIMTAAIAAVVIIKVKYMGATKEQSPEDIFYNYIIALHSESGVELPDHKQYTDEQKHLFANLCTLGKCPKCNHYYLKKIITCHSCKEELEPIATSSFKTFVLHCEEFHQGLRLASHIATLSYSQIMKLYRLKETNAYVR